MRGFPEKLIIKDAEVFVDGALLTSQDLVIEKGIMTAVQPTGQKFQGAQVIEGADLMVLPLGVDVQAHLRVPGQSHKETPLTGLKAALRGGYGALLTMPNTNPVIDTPTVCDQAMGELKPAMDETGVDVYLSAAMTMSQGGQKTVNAEPLARWGVKAFTDDGKGLASDILMTEMFKVSEKVGLPLLQHAEMPGHGGVLAPGPVQEKLGVKAYLDDPEVEMVRRDIALLRNHRQSRYHVLHVSSLRTIKLVEDAKKEGLPITCEVCPHHLLFTADDVNPDDSSFKMNPPLRSKRDREVLQKALASGAVDFISTDHAPHEGAMKTKDFSSAAFGTTGFEAALRVLLHFKNEGLLSIQKLVNAWSFKPSDFLGIKRFEITVGMPFQGVLVAHSKSPRALEKSELESLSKNSCFVGAKLPGKITYTFNKKGVFEFS